MAELFQVFIVISAGVVTQKSNVLHRTFLLKVMQDITDYSKK